MIKDTIQAIQEAEAKAAGMLAEASEQAKQRLCEAQKEAERLRQEAQEQLREADQRLEEELAEEGKAFLAKSAGELETELAFLKQKAAEKTEQAASELVLHLV